MLLEVFSKGTVVTSYTETEREDPETHHKIKEQSKSDAEFVDVVMFKVTLNGQV